MSKKIKRKKLFGKNPIFKKIESHHELFHSLINENLDCALSGGCMSKNTEKDAIMKRFQEAEEHSSQLFTLMDNLADDIGENVNMDEVLA